MTIEKVTVDSVEIFRDSATDGTGAVTSLDFEVDYTDFASRIADALDGTAGIKAQLTTIATNSTSIAASLATMAEKLTAIEVHQGVLAAKHTIVAEKQTLMEDHQHTLRDLGVGTGIHVISPYEWLGYSALYRLLVEQGNLLDTGENVSAADEAKALAALKVYLAKIEKLPRMF